MVVGLGNPGPDYQETRHNAGFWFLDRWAGLRKLPFRKAWFRPYSFCTWTQGGDRIVLVKPLTYMNHSGRVIEGLFARWGAGVGDLLVVFDQMDLAPGRTRLKPHGTHAGHNGLRSVDEALGGGGYHRLAVGIGRPTSGSIIDHVLGVPSDEHRAAIDQALARVVSRVDELWSQGWEPLLHAVNQRDPA